MIGKYTNKVKGTRRRQTPETWISGPDPIEHEKYYAWLKHRAQAKFRNEEHTLTWEDWQTLWPTDLFLKRGRGVDDLCVSIVNLEHGWHIWNVTICTRREHLQRAREYRDRSRL
jgi:hypothetical protein